MTIDKNREKTRFFSLSFRNVSPGIISVSYQELTISWLLLVVPNFPMLAVSNYHLLATANSLGLVFANFRSAKIALPGVPTPYRKSSDKNGGEIRQTPTRKTSEKVINDLFEKVQKTYRKEF